MSSFCELMRNVSKTWENHKDLKLTYTVLEHCTEDTIYIHIRIEYKYIAIASWPVTSY